MQVWDYFKKVKFYFVQGAFDEAIRNGDSALDKGRSARWGLGGNNAEKREVSERSCDEAISYYTRAIDLYSLDAKVYYKRGLTYFAQSKVNKANADLTKAIELDPKDPEACSLRAVAFLEQGDLNESIADWTRAIKLNSQKARYYYLYRGLIYLKQGKEKEAIADFAEAVERSYSYTHTEPFREHCVDIMKEYFTCGFYRCSLACFADICYPRDTENYIIVNDKYIERTNDTTVYYNRGNHKLNHEYYCGYLEEAVKDYTNYTELDPKDPVAYNRRGKAYFKLKKYDEAIADFTKAIELNPLYTEAYYNRGNAYYWQHKLNEALANFTKYIELDPIDAQVFVRRGWIYFEQGKFNDASTDFTRYIELDLTEPDRIVYGDPIVERHRERYLLRGTAYFKQRRFNEAILDYTKQIELYPQDAAVAYGNRGTAYLEQGELDQAIADFNEAIKARVEWALPYSRRGKAYLKQGKLNEAIADFTKAIELNPKEIDNYINRAEAYQRNDQKALAIYDQEKVFRLTSVPSLTDKLKFFILGNHTSIIAKNSVRHFIENTPTHGIQESITDKLREVLEHNNITPDSIDLKRKSQGYVTGTPTLFDEIRKEEEFYLRLYQGSLEAKTIDGFTRQAIALEELRLNLN